MDYERHPLSEDVKLQTINGKMTRKKLFLHTFPVGKSPEETAAKFQKDVSCLDLSRVIKSNVTRHVVGDDVFRPRFCRFSACAKTAKCKRFRGNTDILLTCPSRRLDMDILGKHRFRFPLLRRAGRRPSARNSLRMRDAR